MSIFPRTWLAISISAIFMATSAQAETSVQENSTENQGVHKESEAPSTSSQDVATKSSVQNSDDDSSENNTEAAPELKAILAAANDQTIDVTEQCFPPDNAEPNSLPTKVEADSLEGVNGQEATYSGNVQVTQGNNRLSADTVTLHQQDNLVVATGNVKMTNGQIRSVSDKATTNLDTDVSTLEMANYSLLCQSGRGDAKVIRVEGKAYYELEDGSITSCPEDDDSWRLVSSSIEIDNEAEEATLYNPRFEIQKVPVFYLPWLTVPIGDNRKTGFLYPTVSYGTSDGAEVEIPFYWNLAPNYDLETTAKYMSERGTQLDGKFRYLSDFGRGEIQAQYLGDDQKYPDLDDRWGVGYKHYGVFDRNWKLQVDYAKVSDIYYFRDISSSIGEREDGQLLQQGQVSWRNEHWDTSLLVRDFQLLSTTTNLPYQMMPQLRANYYFPELTDFIDFDVISHITQFKTDDARGVKPISATRVHIEPGVKIPLTTTWGGWETEGRLLTTYYNQDLSNMNPGSVGDLKQDVTRVIPEFRSSGSLYLERGTSVFKGYTQTLEPRVQYLYVPDEDQSDIYNYDTTLMQTDYYGLFRTRKFSGVDKIVSANQVSYGATTRFYDQNYRERLNLSFGQIYYLNDNSNNNSSNNQEDNNYSAWAVEADFNVNDYVFYHGGIQYDIGDEEVQLANSTLEYRRGAGYVQTNYRFVSRKYIEDSVDGINVGSVTNDGISQVGLLGGYKFNKNWNVNAQYFHDTTENIMLEALARLTYTSDCWYVGVTYTDQLRSWDTVGAPNPGPEYEENISFNIGIIGFGTNFGTDYGDGGNALGYGRPFYLNN
ncbi:LPS assembly protein LptD [Vibrio gallicus]|uniref:LPS assembly protein LptD n=1 Tax=Vibrio gallicus TaxID=190897 RepID=UPI0021C3DDF9|nr:LPS assembly protein LptD [Vibrio gallicus]